MTKSPKGFLVIALKTQGRKVIDEEVLTDGPVSRLEAENKLKVEVVTRLIRTGGNPS